MVLYVILEGVLTKTLSGQDIPKKISDLKLNREVFEWIKLQDFSDIVILSNQTWIYGSPGIKVEERFWSKIKYVSECLREELESLGKIPRIHIRYSIKRPWISGLSDSGPTLLEDLWTVYPGIKEDQSIYLCRPIDFDIEYAKRLGLINIKTEI